MSKIKYEDIKDATSFHGWELISKEYINLNEKDISLDITGIDKKYQNWIYA